MTVKDASKKFKKTEREIYQAIKDGLLDAPKNNRKYDIPEGTEIIITKSEVQLFLLHVLRYKNNENIVISGKYCPQVEQLKVVSKLLYTKGYIGNLNSFNSQSDFLNQVKLTDEGFALALGRISTKLNKSLDLSFNPSINFNIGLLNVG